MTETRLRSGHTETGERQTDRGTERRKVRGTGVGVGADRQASRVTSRDAES